MTELADLLPKGGADVRLRSARVISVNGSQLIVDMGGGVSVIALDSCNPVPDQTVLLAIYGTSWTAVGVLGGSYRQATLTVTASTSTTVTGLVNGVSTVVPKTSSGSVSNGDVLPLLWSADASRVWAITKEQVATTAPPAASSTGSSSAVGGGRSSAGSSVPTEGIAYYSPTQVQTYDHQNARWTGQVTSIPKANHGGFFYGSRRFQELQGRTITSCLVSISGGSTRTFYRHNLAGPSGPPSLTGIGSRYTSGWVDLGASVGAALVSAGTAGLYVGSGGSTISGGRLQVGWRI